MERHDYSEMVYGFLSLSPKNSDFGPRVRSYRIDYRHDAFYFFAKCPEEVLDVEVYGLIYLYSHPMYQVWFVLCSVH